MPQQWVNFSMRNQFTALALGVSSLALMAAPASAQSQTPPATPAPASPRAAPAAAPVLDQSSGTVTSINVVGNERLEPETVRSYIDLDVGSIYNRDRLDRVLKALYATELFSDVTIRDAQGAITIEVRENPVINRILLEGNKRLKEDKIREEIRLAPRQIFTRSKASADVARILELYRRQGRFAASVQPKIVQLDQNRVDVVFEMTEGPKSKVRAINIIGNSAFKDGKLIKEMATRPTKWYNIFTSRDTYDPDRSAYDQQKLRQFYLTKGYADFRVVSSVAELTPDRKDFIITYVVEEGDRYKFGDVDVESEIRDIKPEDFKSLVRIKKGDWYNAKKIEDTVTLLSESAGLIGYAFADVRPQFNRDKEKRTMSVNFVINEAPRVYVERININGNTRTKDSVIRREFRLAEGDAFNSVKVKRSRDRIQSLGFFQEKLEVEQKPGSGPDKVVLEVNVEEKPTGELQVSAGFSSIERFIVNLSIRERNFRGKNQELRASVNWSSYSKSIELGFTEPYLFGKNLALGGDIFRRDYDSFRFTANNNRDTTYRQLSTGGQIRTGFPITEYLAAQFRYSATYDEVTLDRFLFFTGGQCDPYKAGIYLCEAIGKRLTSSLGYTLAFDTLNNRIRPSRGHRVAWSQDVAGVGGDVKYVRSTLSASKYWGIRDSGFIFSVSGEGGYTFGWGGDNVRLTDRFFLGEPRLRGFDIRGVGPRSIRKTCVTLNPCVTSTDPNAWVDDALGGNAYYLAHAELEIPLGAGGAQMGLRPSIFVDVGGLWDTGANPSDKPYITKDSFGNPLGILDTYVGDSWKPRVSVGAGVSWNSPFGPFRIDLAKALTKVDGDQTQLFQFNIGTTF